MTNLDFQSLSYIVGAGGAAFGIFLYFRNPQISLEKGESLMSLTIKNIQSDLINLRDNHIHTLDTKIDGTNARINQLSLEVTRLATIIDERIPQKR